MKIRALLFSFTLVLLYPFTSAWGVVALDNCSTSSTTSGTSLTWSHTVTGTNNYLVTTFHGVGGAVGEVSGITYNAVSMTLKQISTSASDPGPDVESFELVAPATGAHNVVISNPDSVPYVGSACSFTGVHQVTPSGTPVTNRADPLSSGTVTVPANGMAFEVGIWGQNSDCVAPVPQAGGQTSAFTAVCVVTANNYLGFGSTRDTTGAFTWDTSGSAWTASTAIPINAAAAGAATRLKKALVLQ